MQNIQFPVQFTFRISTFANDFTATDANGQIMAYVRQKMFKLKEDIAIYADTSKTKINYRIKADRWLDFSAVYSFFDETGVEFGKIARKGWKSIWKSHYEIIDEDERPQYTIHEENPWIKVLDSFLGEIPILSLLTGYLFNPSYLVIDANQNKIVRLKKQPSFFGRRFLLTKIGTMDSDDDDRVMLGLMMMILLERRRG
ncbi:MAG: hypothetical protein H6553_13080 [Chitinophagales bacterium]|nr:hypothetical protein [Chitinophagales bacterium]